MMSKSLTALAFLAVLLPSALPVYVPPTRGGVECTILSHIGDYSYNRLTNINPYKWGEKKAYRMCGVGDSQSPIDFPLDVVKANMKYAPDPHFFATKLKFHSKTENWAIECLGKHKCGYTKFRGKKYYVHGLHFHFPSEHTIEGRQYPMEAHLVHVADDGNLAVLATLFDYPAEKPYAMHLRDFQSNKPNDYGVHSFVQHIFKQLIDQKHIEENRPIRTNLKGLLKLSDGICAYSGSLTTPPCSENVWFFMQMKVQTVSKQQVDTFAKSVGAPVDGINRPTQPLNKRKITCFMP